MKHDPELKYKCPACPKQFVKANTLRAHISNVHKGSKPQKKCKKCDVTVFSENGLYAHMKQVHGEEVSHPCPECGEIFLVESHLKEHRLRHLAPKVQGLKEEKVQRSTKCPECEQDLETGDTLVSHFASVHPGQEARFQCSECSGGAGGEQELSAGGAGGEQERFLSLAGARRHYRLQHKSRPHVCWICKESFAREEVLHLHLVSSHVEVTAFLTAPSGAPGGGSQRARCSAVQVLRGSLTRPHAEGRAHQVLHPVVSVCKEGSAEIIAYRHSHMVETIDITSTDLDEVSILLK